MADRAKGRAPAPGPPHSMAEGAGPVAGAGSSRDSSLCGAHLSPVQRRGPLGALSLKRAAVVPFLSGDSFVFRSPSLIESLSLHWWQFTRPVPGAAVDWGGDNVTGVGSADCKPVREPSLPRSLEVGASGCHAVYLYTVLYTWSIPTVGQPPVPSPCVGKHRGVTG